MEQNGDRLVFTSDEQAVSKLPETVPLVEAARIRAKVQAQLEAVLSHRDELSMGPHHATAGQARQLGTKAFFLGGVIRQLNGIIDPSPTAGVDEELRRLTD